MCDFLFETDAHEELVHQDLEDYNKLKSVTNKRLARKAELARNSRRAKKNKLRELESENCLLQQENAHLKLEKHNRRAQADATMSLTQIASFITRPRSLLYRFFVWLLNNSDSVLDSLLNTVANQTGAPLRAFKRIHSSLAVTAKRELYKYQTPMLFNDIPTYIIDSDLFETALYQSLCFQLTPTEYQQFTQWLQVNGTEMMLQKNEDVTKDISRTGNI